MKLLGGSPGRRVMVDVVGAAMGLSESFSSAETSGTRALVDVGITR